jgi:hypothetical protein
VYKLLALNLNGGKLLSPPPEDSPDTEVMQTPAPLPAAPVVVDVVFLPPPPPPMARKSVTMMPLVKSRLLLENFEKLNVLDLLNLTLTG